MSFIHRDEQGNAVFKPFKRAGQNSFTATDAKLIGELRSTYLSATNKAPNAGDRLHERLVISTSNADYLPEVNLGTQNIKVYHDGRWGAEDYGQWPQWFFDEQEHFAYILRKPNSSDLKNHPFRILWFDMDLSHFVFMNGSQEVGMLLPSYARDIFSIRTKLLEEVANTRCPDGEEFNKLHKLASCMKATTSSLLNTPLCFLDVMITLSAAQRFCLETRALLDKINKWDKMAAVTKPRPVDNTILGCITDRAPLVHLLYDLGVPVWFVRPLSHVSSTLSIRKQCTCTTPEQFGVNMTPWPGALCFYSGPLDREIHKTIQKWKPGAVKHQYLEQVSTAEAASGNQESTAGRASLGAAPYSTAAASAKVSSKAATFSLNKQLFEPITASHVPKPLETWKSALRSVHTEAPIINHPLRSIFRGYAFPPPLLFVNTNEERSVDTMLAWLLIRPSWMLLISDRNRTKPLPGPQQWRDYLNQVALGLELGRKDTRGHYTPSSSTKPTDTAPSAQPVTAPSAQSNSPSSVAPSRRTPTNRKKEKEKARRDNIKHAIAEIFTVTIPPKLEIQSIEWNGHHVWENNDIHLTSLDRKLAIWDAHEHNFRLEFLTLDRAIMSSVWKTVAGRAAREEKHREFWPDGVCFMMGLPSTGSGIGVANWVDRRTFVKAFGNIIMDWPGEETKLLRDTAFYRLEGSEEIWDKERMEEFEQVAAIFYCQMFYIHFGRAPCIPYMFPVA